MKSNLTERFFTAKTMAANATSSTLDVSAIASGAFLVAWTGQTSADATVKVQEGDGTTWFDVGSGSATLDSSASEKLGPFTFIFPKVQIVLTKNTETTGTVSVTGYFKP